MTVYSLVIVIFLVKLYFCFYLILKRKENFKFERKKFISIINREWSKFIKTSRSISFLSRDYQWLPYMVAKGARSTSVFFVCPFLKTEPQLKLPLTGFIHLIPKLSPPLGIVGTPMVVLENKIILFNTIPIFMGATHRINIDYLAHLYFFQSKKSNIIFSYRA